MVDVAYFGALAVLTLTASFLLATYKILTWPTSRNQRHVPRRTVNTLVDEINQYLDEKRH